MLLSSPLHLYDHSRSFPDCARRGGTGDTISNFSSCFISCLDETIDKDEVPEKETRVL